MTRAKGKSRAVGAVEELWSEALRRWYEQEDESLPPPEFEVSYQDERPFPPGWWIVPAIVMSLGIWAVIGWMILT